MSLEEEKAWFDENIRKALASALSHIGDFNTRANNIQSDLGLRALISRLETTADTLNDTAERWCSHTEELIAKTANVESQSATLADRINDVGHAYTAYQAAESGFRQADQYARNGAWAASNLVATQLRLRAERAEAQISNLETVEAGRVDLSAGLWREMAAVEKRNSELEISLKDSRKLVDLQAEQIEQYKIAREHAERRAEEAVAAASRAEQELSETRSGLLISPEVEQRPQGESVQAQNNIESFRNVATDAEMADVSAPAPTDLNQPAQTPGSVEPWSMIDFGGDQALESEFKQTFGSWSREKMQTDFDRICKGSSRAPPDRICLTSVCGFGSHSRWCIKKGDATAQKQSCPVHQQAEGLCMKIRFVGGLSEADEYVVGQQRYRVSQRT